MTQLSTWVVNIREILLLQIALRKTQRFVSSRSQPPGWECILNGLLALVKLLEAAAPPEWVPSLEAGNQLE
ncbi:MAG: hypothetical protein V7K86_08205 [Nostoc sp.]|uniref:hypothetical protein n=1 Tax=Nostoc sp. TaxID=1180 RepID=UPI002FF61386